MSRKNHMTIIRSFILNCIVCIGAIFLILVLQNNYPLFYLSLVMEDSWGEYFTFVCYLLSGLMIASAIKNNPDLRKPGFVLLGLGFLFIAMEEISWGQRFLGIKLPYNIAKYNYQSEMSIHNLYIFPKESVFYFAILIWAFLVPVLGRYSQKVQSLFDRLGMPYLRLEFMPYFALSLVILFSKFIIENDEIGEVILGFSFLLFTVNLYKESAGTNICRSLNLVKTITVMLSVIFVMTYALVRTNPIDANSKSFYLHLFANEHYRTRALHDKVKDLFDYILANPDYKRDNTTIQYAEYLLDIGDPDSTRLLGLALDEENENVAKQPDKPKPYLMKGRIYRLLQDDAGAIRNFQMAIKKNHDRLLTAKENWEKCEIYESLGEIHVEMGDKRLALQNFNEALKYVEEAWKEKRINKLRKEIN